LKRCVQSVSVVRFSPEYVMLCCVNINHSIQLNIFIYTLPSSTLPTNVMETSRP